MIDVMHDRSQKTLLSSPDRRNGPFVHARPPAARLLGLRGDLGTAMGLVDFFVFIDGLNKIEIDIRGAVHLTCLV